MNYAALIEAAAKRHGISEYAVAKRLGYKNVSAIYQIKKGKLGMRAERYAALLRLANGRGMYIMSTPRSGLRPVAIAANDPFYTATCYG